MKVILIGNGSSVMDHEYGSLIDTFDVVVRFNRFRTKGYEKNVGTKTTHWIIVDSGWEWLNGYVEGVEGSDPKVLESFDKVMFCIPAFKFNMEVNKLSQLNLDNNKYGIIGPDVEATINDIVDFRPQWPTTGLIAMEYFSKEHKDVYTYGFDGHNKRYKDYHYFDKNDPKRTTEHAWREGRVDHNLEKENLYLDYMFENKKVNLLTNYHNE